MNDRPSAEPGIRIDIRDLSFFYGDNQALKELWANHPEQLTWWTRFFDWI